MKKSIKLFFLVVFVICFFSPISIVNAISGNVDGYWTSDKTLTGNVKINTNSGGNGHGIEVDASITVNLNGKTLTTSGNRNCGIHVRGADGQSGHIVYHNIIASFKGTAGKGPNGGTIDARNNGPKSSTGYSINGFGNIYFENLTFYDAGCHFGIGIGDDGAWFKAKNTILNTSFIWTGDGGTSNHKGTDIKGNEDKVLNAYVGIKDSTVNTGAILKGSGNNNKIQIVDSTLNLTYADGIYKTDTDFPASKNMFTALNYHGGHPKNPWSDSLVKNVTKNGDGIFISGSTLDISGQNISGMFYTDGTTILIHSSKVTVHGSGKKGTGYNGKNNSHFQYDELTLKNYNYGVKHDNTAKYDSFLCYTYENSSGGKSFRTKKVTADSNNVGFSGVRINGKITVMAVNNSTGIIKGTISAGNVTADGNTTIGMYNSQISGGNVTVKNTKNNKNGISKTTISGGTVSSYSNSHHGINSSKISGTAVVNAYQNQTATGISATTISGGTVRSYNNGDSGSGYGFFKDNIEGGKVYTYASGGTTGNRYGLYLCSISKGTVDAAYNKNGVGLGIIAGTISGSADIEVHDNKTGIGTASNYTDKTHLSYAQIKGGVVKVHDNTTVGITGASISGSADVRVYKHSGNGIESSSISGGTVKSYNNGTNIDLSKKKINGGDVTVYGTASTGIKNGTIEKGTIKTYSGTSGNKTGISGTTITGGNVEANYNSVNALADVYAKGTATIKVENNTSTNGSYAVTRSTLVSCNDNIINLNNNYNGINSSSVNVKVTVTGTEKGKGEGITQTNLIKGATITKQEKAVNLVNGHKISGGDIVVYNNTNGIVNGSITGGNIKTYSGTVGNEIGINGVTIGDGTVDVEYNTTVGVKSSKITGGNVTIKNQKTVNVTGITASSISGGNVIVQDNINEGDKSYRNKGVDGTTISAGIVTVKHNNIGINGGSITGGDITIDNNWRALEKTTVNGNADIKVKNHIHYGTDGDNSTVWYCVNEVTIKSFKSFELNNNFNGIHHSVLEANGIKITGRGKGNGTGIKNSNITNNVTICDQYRGFFFQRYGSNGKEIIGWDSQVKNGIIKISNVKRGIETTNDTPRENKIIGGNITIYDSETGIYNTGIGGGYIDIYDSTVAIDNSIIKGTAKVYTVRQSSVGINNSDLQSANDLEVKDSYFGIFGGTINITKEYLKIQKNTVGINTCNNILQYVKVEGKGLISNVSGVLNSTLKEGAEAYNNESGYKVSNILLGKVYTYDTDSNLDYTKKSNTNGLLDCNIQGGTIYAINNSTGIYGKKYEIKPGKDEKGKDKTLLVEANYNKIGISTAIISGGTINVSSNSGAGIRYTKINNGYVNVYENKGNGIIFSTITGGSVISSYNGIPGYDANDPYDSDGVSYCNITGGTITANGNTSQGFWYCDIKNAVVYAYDNVQPGIWGSTINSGKVEVYKNGTDGLSNRTSGIYASTIQGGTVYTYDNCPSDHIKGGTVDSIGIDNSLIGKKKDSDRTYASNAVIISSENNIGIRNTYINGGTISLIDNNTKREGVTSSTASRSITDSSIYNSSMTIEATTILKNNKVGLQSNDNNKFYNSKIWISGFSTAGITGGSIINSNVMVMENKVGIKISSNNFLDITNSTVTSSNKNEIGLQVTDEVKGILKGTDQSSVVIDFDGSVTLNPKSTIYIVRNSTGVQVNNKAQLVMEKIEEKINNIIISNNIVGLEASSSGKIDMYRSNLELKENITAILAQEKGVINIGTTTASVSPSTITIKGYNAKINEEVLKEHTFEEIKQKGLTLSEKEIKEWTASGYLTKTFEDEHTGDDAISKYLKEKGITFEYIEENYFGGNSVYKNKEALIKEGWLDSEGYVTAKGLAEFNNDADKDPGKDMYKDFEIVMDKYFTKEGLEAKYDFIKTNYKIDLYSEDFFNYKEGLETFGIKAIIGGQVNIILSNTYINNISSIGISGANIYDSYVKISSSAIGVSGINKIGLYGLVLEGNDVGLKGTTVTKTEVSGGYIRAIGNKVGIKSEGNSIVTINNSELMIEGIGKTIEGSYGIIGANVTIATCSIVEVKKNKVGIDAATLHKVGSSYMFVNNNETGLREVKISSSYLTVSNNDTGIEGGTINNTNMAVRNNTVGINGKANGKITMVGTAVDISNNQTGVILDKNTFEMSGEMTDGVVEERAKYYKKDGHLWYKNEKGIETDTGIPLSSYAGKRFVGEYVLKYTKDSRYTYGAYDGDRIWFYNPETPNSLWYNENDNFEGRNGEVKTLLYHDYAGSLNLAYNGEWDKNNNWIGIGINAKNGSTIKMTSMTVTSEGNDMVWLNGGSKLNIAASTITLTKNAVITKTDGSTATITSTAIVVKGGESGIDFTDSLVTFSNDEIGTLIKVENGTGNITINHSIIEGEIIGAGTKNVTLTNNSKWYVNGQSNITKLESKTGNNYIVLIAQGKNVSNLTVTNEFIGNFKLDVEDLESKVSSGSILAVNLEKVTTIKGNITTDGIIDIGTNKYSLDKVSKSYYLINKGKSNIAKLASKVPSITNAVVTAGLNSLTRRLGDIRRTPEDKLNGVWARVYGRNDKFTKEIETKMEMTGAEGGYDRQIMKEKKDRYYIGAMVGYQNINKIETKKEKVGTKQNGEGTAPSVGVYGTWIAENGLFADITVRNFWISLDMNETIKGCKPYRNQIAISGEFGKEFELYSENSTKVVIEPKTEWVYSYAGSASSKQLEYGTTNSIKGKIGFMLGLNAQTTGGINWQPYMEAGYSYEFDNKTEVRYLGINMGEQDLSGGYGDIGVGLNVYLGKGFSGYSLVSYEKGSDQENFVYNVGFRYGF